MRRAMFLFLVAATIVALFPQTATATTPRPSTSEETSDVSTDASGTVTGTEVAEADVAIIPDSGSGPQAQADPSCNMSLTVDFTGQRVGEFLITNGRFESWPITSCNITMTLLRVELRITDNLGEPHDGGVESCTSCSVEGFVDVHFCDVCNGRWEFDSTHTLTLPPGYSWGAPSPDCVLLTSRTAECSLHVEMIIA